MRAGRHFRLVVVAAAIVSLAAAAAAADRATAGDNKQQACGQVPAFASAKFSRPTVIDNKFLPLVAGTRFVLEGKVGGKDAPPHTVIFTVTGVTKVVAGIETVVVWDRDISDGQIAEEELAFWAQDDAGNVWNVGEYPEEHEDGKITAPSTWLAGVKGSIPGIHMWASRAPGSPWYLQGWAPSVDFLDCARVKQAGVKVCVPATVKGHSNAAGGGSCFRETLVIDEMSPFDKVEGERLPLQRKAHAKGFGIVKITPVYEPDGETLVLTEYRKLGKSALDAANRRALFLDGRAYKRVPGVWKGTPRAEVKG